MITTKSNYTEAEQAIIDSKLWKRPQNYAGPDYFGTIGVVGQSRDSDTLDRCNFAVAFDRLGGKETKDVQIIRDSHWAVGWVEALRVNIRNVKRTREALAILAKLEDYPILDEEEFGSMEHEEACETFDFYRDEFQRELEKYLGRPVDSLPASDVTEFLSDVFHEDAGYRGYPDAFVTEQSIARFIDGNYTNYADLVKRGNAVACLISGGA